MPAILPAVMPRALSFPTPQKKSLARSPRRRSRVRRHGRRAGTGVVGGRIPFGGVILATDKLNRIKNRSRRRGGWAIVRRGVRLADFRRAVEAQHLLYPPDPTEASCYMGATVATNSSGARTFNTARRGATSAAWK